MRAVGQRKLRVLQASGAADDDVHADEQAQEGAGQQQEAGDVGLLLLGAQHGQAAGQQEPLALDEGNSAICRIWSLVVLPDPVRSVPARSRGRRAGRR